MGLQRGEPFGFGGGAAPERGGTGPSPPPPEAPSITPEAESKGRICIIKGVIVPFRVSSPFVLLSNRSWQFFKRLKNVARGDINAEGKNSPKRG